MPEQELIDRGFRIARAGVHWELELADGQNIDAVVDFLRSRQLSIRQLVEKRQTLEDLFLKTVEDAQVGTLSTHRRDQIRREHPQDPTTDIRAN
jgi:hypothetical protein